MTERLQALADLVPVLGSADADFGHWEVPAPVGGSLVAHLPPLVIDAAQEL